MKTVLLIAFRNFMRQKRRNILLGSAIAFGVIVLTVAQSFAHGLSDNLLHRLIAVISGHIRVQSIEYGRVMSPIIRDKERVLSVIRESIDGIKTIQEDVGAFGRAIGNGKGDYVFLVGVELTDMFTDQFQLLEGSFENFTNGTVAYPLILSEQKAKYLNVKVGDIVRVRISNVNGQNETGALTLVAIVKSQNMYMDYAVFLPLDDIKQLTGYRPYETGAFSIMLEKPKTATEKASLIHSRLTPDTAYIHGKTGGRDVTVVAVSYAPSENVVRQYVPFDAAAFSKGEGVIISRALATALRKSVGDSIAVTYQPKFEKEQVSVPFSIVQISDFNPSLPDHVILAEPETFFKLYNFHLPNQAEPLSRYIPAEGNADLLGQLATEWRLLARSETSQGFQQKFKDLLKDRRYQPLTDVSSMYESAADFLKMEAVLNFVTFAAAAIIFFIIMIGVLNSLRMQIRERTREIGTVRAIGMRRGHVKLVFLMEIVYLVAVSWLVGTVLSFLIMYLLKLIQFSYDNALSMLMVDRRLYFVTTWQMLLQNLLLVLVFGMVTAYFPARRASLLNPAEAFRHMS